MIFRVINMIKNVKFIAVMIAFILLISSFTVISANAANVAYTVTNVSGKKGDTVTVAVKISSDAEIWGANVMLGYNPYELQYVSSSKGDSVSSGSLHNTGSSINYSGTYSNTNGTVFTVKFKILKDSGTSALRLTSTENIDYNGKNYACSVADGTVTVNSSSLLGDANGDGMVSGIDARIVLQHSANIVTLDTSTQKLVDVNKDGNVTSIDARWILQIAAGIRNV